MNDRVTYVNGPADLPPGDHYCVLKFGTIYIPGDTETTIGCEVHPTREAWLAEIERDGVSTRYPEVPTLTCARCGVRFAWLPTTTIRVAAASGYSLDALVAGRPPRRCETLSREVTP